MQRSVLCVFRKPSRFTDSLIALRAGRLVHVDILPMDPDNVENSLSYTSYVGEHFSMSLSAKHDYDDDTCVALELKVSPEEHECLIAYLNELFERNIPYNYKDLAVMALPCTLQDSLVSDILSESPEDIQSLFCSQAVVLALRNSLAQDRALFRQLRMLNSRTIYPCTLYHVLRPYTKMVSCNGIRRGEIKYTTTSEIF